MPNLKTTTTRFTIHPASFEIVKREDYPLIEVKFYDNKADFNGDGKLDTVALNIVNYQVKGVSILLNGSNTPTIFDVGDYSNCVSVADFNGDGNLDLITANGSDEKNAVSLLLGNGKGSFGTPTIFAVGDYQSDFINTGDFNKDGKLDLVVASRGSESSMNPTLRGSVSVLLGDGKGSFGTPTIYAAGWRTSRVDVADFNNDGKLDLVTIGSASNISILYGDGKGSFSSPFSNINGVNTLYIGHIDVADFNGDGKADLLTVMNYSNYYSGINEISDMLLNTTVANKVSKGDVIISGVLQQNTTLTVSNKLSDTDGLGAISNQWQSNNVDIVGATQNTYALTQSDVGKIIGVRASYTDKLGNLESVTSTAVAKVKNVNDLPTGDVLIQGEPKEGKTLTASNTLADADGLGAISYQWQADGKIIKGATSESYTLTPAEHGKAISVKASYTDGQGTKESMTSKQTDLVTNHVPTGEIAINGDAKVGEVLSIMNTLADVDGLGDFSYQWLINGYEPYTSSVISNTDTFVIPESSMMSGSTIGKTISVKVSYFDGEGTDEVVVSKPTLAISAASSEPTFGNDKLVGMDQNDTLSALAGNDTLIGGVGADILTGGQGADVFKFNNASETGITSATRDVITDFNPSEGDKIDVYSIYGTFRFIGSDTFNFGFDGWEQLRFDATSHILYGNTNGDSKPEFSIQLNGVKSLVADDFIL